MSVDMQLFQEVKAMAKKVRNDDSDSGTHYLLGYMWATLTPKQQKEIAKSFAEELSEVLER
jgi:ABC-type transporter MlaC component